MSLEQVLAATVSSEGARFTEEQTTEDPKGRWRLTCEGHVTWQPAENSQWTCQNDAATAESQIEAGLASGSVDEVVAGSTNEVRVVDSQLYQQFGAPGAELIQADLSAGGDLCLLVATGYCTAPGNMLYQLQTAGFVTTQTPDGLKGSTAIAQGTTDLTSEYSLTVDDAGRIKTVTIVTVISPENADSASSTWTVTFEEYGPQERVSAPTS